jgi:hypothetical protein
MNVNKHQLKTLLGDIPDAYCQRHGLEYPFGGRCPECELPPQRGPARYVKTDAAPLGAMAKAMKEAGYFPRR